MLLTLTKALKKNNKHQLLLDHNYDLLIIFGKTFTDL